MPDHSNFMLDLSVLYRNTQKYYDHVLRSYDIGSGQVIFLMLINENEGITMQDVTRLSEVDKGTTTKSVNRLITQGYVQTRQDEKDKRVKRLYTTEKAAGIMNDIYEYRNECRNALADGVDFDQFNAMLSKVTDNSRKRLQPEKPYTGIRIGGLQRMTLLDYPGKVACTVFLSGCSFKCPYCHNRDLVYIPENYEFFDPDDVLAYLKKRQGLLDGVCISGGEPLLQEDLKSFIEQIKSLGYLVKLDTNGNEPAALKELVESGLIDYVAMDVKNIPEKYALTTGMDPSVFSCDAIKESVEYLKSNPVEHEFRTTVVKEFHEMEDIIGVAKWIAPSDHYYLQQFQNSENLIKQGWHAYDADEMKKMLEEVRKYVPQAELRGVKEV